MIEFMMVLLFPVVIGIWLGVRIVPQGEEWVVERLGRFHRVLEPGLNVIIPMIDQVRYKVTTKDIRGGPGKLDSVLSDNLA
jgi:regulator of protease activity HflC (stomatin/prohibitin superfamily)